MSDAILKKFETLVNEGANLAPLGGFEFSGYNARLQDTYLAWRKACLESLEQVGPIGFSYKNKIVADANGGFFYQASAHLIYTSVREMFEKLKASPDLAAEAAHAPAAAAPVPTAESPASPSSGTRILKPPTKPAAPAPVSAPSQAPQAAPAACKSAYVIGELNDPLRQQLTSFLEEVGVKEIAIDRMHGEMLALDSVVSSPDAKFAFFIFNSDDVNYAMFELGHFVGKLGKNHVMVLHMTDVDVPKNIPGVLVKPIVVKLEEASLSIIKELRSAGYALTL
jgi:hypothetical protein